MTLVSDIITDAYRESNLLAIGTTPTTDQQTEALRLLNRVVSSVYGHEAGEQLDPMPIGRNNIVRPSGYPWYNQTPDWNDWYVPGNTRLVLNLTAPLSVYLGPNPDDGTRFAIQDASGNLSTFPLTVVANGRLIDNATSETFTTNFINKEFFYRQDTGNWAVLSPLGLTDTFPFPPEFDDLFVTMLAQRVNPRYGVPIDPQSSQTMVRMLNQFKARYRQHQFVPAELGLIRTTGSRRRYYDNTRFANSAFNSGYAYPFSQWPFVI